MRFFRPPAQARFFHASPDAPPVDIYLNNKKVVSRLAFKNFSNYHKLKPGEYQLEIYPSSLPKLNPVFRKRILLPPGSTYTVSIINRVNNLNILIINDPQKSPEENFNYLRAVHLSPNAPAVNIRANNFTIVRNLRYKDISNYARLNPKTYDLTILTTTGKEVLKIPNQVLQSNFYQTLYIIGLIDGDNQLQTVITTDGIYQFRPL